ncbi:MAG: acyl carrier protein [Prevotella sp.]|nr:acyl carrier protein [Prevotella sp.]
MERNEVLERLKPIFRTVFNDESLDVDETMEAEDFDNWDSVTQMLIVASVEKEFNVNFKLREVGELNSVAAFIDGVEKKLQ